MNAISVDSQGHARSGSFSPKAVGTAAIVAGALGVAGLGVYWLAAAPPDVRNEAPAVAPERRAAPAVAEPLLDAPSATCVDGRPANEKVPADACL